MKQTKQIDPILNDRIKSAVSRVRLFGGSVEVLMHSDGSPYDETRHGAWCGSLASLKELRAWVAATGGDGRRVSLYCTNGETSEETTITL